MATAGPSLPTAGANDASVGSTAWTNPGNITANDGTYAVAGVPNGGTSQLLVGTDFDFAIPDGATINGIEVAIERKSGVGTALHIDLAITLYQAGAVAGDNKADTGTQWLTSDAVATYGGAADTWGLSLSAADVNDAGFGVAVRCDKNINGVGNASVDYLTMTVHYTEAAAGGSRSMMMGCGR